MLPVLLTMKEPLSAGSAAEGSIAAIDTVGLEAVKLAVTLLFVVILMVVGFDEPEAYPLQLLKV